MQSAKRTLSFPAGGLTSYRAKHDTFLCFQIAGIQKTGCPTKALGHDNFIFIDAVLTVRNISK